MTISNDLRTRALFAYYEDCLSCKKICDQFYISLRAFYNWRKEFESLDENNEVKSYQYNKKPTKRKPKKPKYNGGLFKFIKDYIINRDNFRMKNLISDIKKEFGKTLKPTNIYYILRRLKITYKKAKHAVIKKPEDYNNKVNNLINTVNKIGTNNIISIDECHFETNMSPNYGWSLSGQRTIFTKKSGDRKNASLICAISEQKVVYYEIYNGSVNSHIYLNFLKNLNKRCKNKTYLMDNARTHHAKIITKHMDGLTNKILYNVPYSPQTNPIEQKFSKLKNDVKREDTESFSKLINAIQISINNITKNDLANYFKHSFG